MISRLGSSDTVVEVRECCLELLLFIESVASGAVLDCRK